MKRLLAPPRVENHMAALRIPVGADPADLITYGELGLRGEPSEPVVVSGHFLWRYDDAKAVRLRDRVKEFGGRARLSADLGYMHAPSRNGQVPPLVVLGYDVAIDESLPANSVVGVTQWG
jgi:hypothetical protein